MNNNLDGLTLDELNALDATATAQIAWLSAQITSAPVQSKIQLNSTIKQLNGQLAQQQQNKQAIADSIAALSVPPTA